MSAGTALVLTVLLVLGNGFFVGAEFALLSARRTQIEPLAEAGSRMARSTLRAMENMPKVIAVNQLGITVCSLLLGALAEPAIAHLVEPGLEVVGLPEGFVHPVAFMIAITIVVYLHVVLGEMIPKNIALAGPERAALLLGAPILAIVTALRPVIVVINLAAAGLLRLIGVRMSDEVGSTYTREQVAGLVEESRGEGLIEADEYTRLAGALGFAEKTVASVLIHPDDLTSVPSGVTIAEVEAACSATGFSRFPVRSEAGWEGYLHIKDVLVDDASLRDRPVDDSLIRPFAAVEPDALLHDALAGLRRRGAHLGLVVDGAGAVRGVVMLEDILEELVGEIRDAAHLADSR